MITDERTRNRLYADTETTLFTLEDKPGAILRIMEIIRDTPEYVQLSPLLPAYAEEGPARQNGGGARNRTSFWRNCCMYFNYIHRKDSYWDR